MKTRRLIAIVSVLLGSSMIGLAADQAKIKTPPAKPAATPAKATPPAPKPAAKAPAKPAAAPAKAVVKVAPKPTPAAVDFVRDIKPILEFNCVGCHREGKIKGELRYDRHDLFP